MKSYLVALLVWILPVCLNAQTLKGRVHVAGTADPILGASVYYSGSTSGTQTDVNGRFTLQGKQEQVPLIISCVGYNSVTLTSYKPELEITVELKPKENDLGAVVVKASDGMSRAEKERLFKREFLGTSVYAQGCTILNMADIYLYFNKRTSTLSAVCRTPIVIRNMMLGYTINYFLDKFNRTPEGAVFEGNFVFKEIPELAGNARIKRNREHAYDGSPMQFIRALWHRNLKKVGYELYNKDFQLIKEDSILARDTANNLYIYLKDRVNLTYNGNAVLVSDIVGLKRASFINQDGFHTSAILWEGEMSKQRIGDMLPYEFQSEWEGGHNKIGGGAGLAKSTAKESAPKTDGKPGYSKAMQQLRALVLTPAGNTEEQLMVRKWEQPLNYKIYGTMGATTDDEYVEENIDSLMAHLAVLTGLKISKVTDDKNVNMIMLMGNPTAFKSTLSLEAVTYLQNKPNGLYYKDDSTGFTNVVIQLDPQKLRKPVEMWSYMRMLVMRGVGFLGGGVSGNDQSVFYNNISTWKVQKGMNSNDERLIKALYTPQIKSGMSEEELNVILQKMAL